MLKYSLLCTVSLIIGASFVTASENINAEEMNQIINTRHGIMENIKFSLKDVTDAFKTGDKKRKIAPLVAILADAASAEKTIPAFKVNTSEMTYAGKHKITATADVWNNWDEFEKGLLDLSEKAETARKRGTTVSLDDIKSIMGSCKSCHTKFRVKE